MPGFITHFICGQAVAHAVGGEAQAIIRRHEAVFNMGTQGPDYFFYYIPGLFKKRMRDMGTKLHTQNVGAFMACLTDELFSPRTGQTDETRQVLFAYISGYLTHYALDARTHPYVYAKTGTPQARGKAAALKTSVDHRRLETAIDVLMLGITGKSTPPNPRPHRTKPADYRLWRLIRADTDKARMVSNTVSTAIQAAYGRNVSQNDVYKAMTHMVQLTRVLQSAKGRRKKWIALIEHMLFGEPVVSSLIHPQTVPQKDGMDCLNIEKKPWTAPWDAQHKKTDSFIELYQTAVREGEDMVRALYRCMHGSVTRERLGQIIGNRSFATGAECL